MKIDSSAITMSSYRCYTAEAEETQSTVTRRYSGDTLQNASVHTKEFEISQTEVEGTTSHYTTSSNGMTREDMLAAAYNYTESNELKDKTTNANSGFQVISAPTNDHWMSNFMSGSPGSSKLDFLKHMLDLLERFTGKKTGRSDYAQTLRNATATANTFQFNASAVSMRYQETMAMFGAQSSEASGEIINIGSTSGSGTNGVWTRQTVQSGFVAGSETTAFSSKGSVVTSDGRSIDFNISIEMSRSFAAAYEITGEETIYTDPLVINMDTTAAELDDVSFYFDLNCDGAAEEISGLNEASGFLALDKNGDGQINDGSELFGAKTGNGFGELAAYDEDGNGWIDENDSVFNRLSVWVKCGTEEAQLLSLAEADVGAVFLGSQSTNYALTDSSGEEGARIRQTGMYLKESGGAGTVQHVDFKA